MENLSLDYGEVKIIVRKQDDDVIPKLCQRKCHNNFCLNMHKIFSLSQYRVYHFKYISLKYSYI